MLTCEKCDATFDPAEGVVEVTSLRVLCPTCLAEHQAAKARQAREGADRAARARTAARGEPAARARPRLPKRTAAGGTRTRPRPARPPAAQVRASHCAAAPRPSRRPMPRRLAGRGPPRAAPGRGRRPARAAGKEPQERTSSATPDQHRSQEEGQARDRDRVRRRRPGAGRGRRACCGRCSGRSAPRPRRSRRELDRVEAFRSEFMGIDIPTEEGAAAPARVRRGEEGPVEPTRTSPPRSSAARPRPRPSSRASRSERDADPAPRGRSRPSSARASELAPSELAEQRRRLDELAPKAEIAGRGVRRARRQGPRRRRARPTSSACSPPPQAAAATEPLDRAALATIQQAEDEILKIFEASYRAWQKNMQDPDLTAKKDELPGRATRRSSSSRTRPWSASSRPR